MASEIKYDIVTLQALYQADLAKYQTISESNTSLDTKNGLLIGAIIAVGVFIFQDPLFAKAASDCQATTFRTPSSDVSGVCLGFWHRPWVSS